MNRFARALPFALLIVAVLGAPACQRVRPSRTLPGWVRGLYIPNFQNLTTEPGLEEVATRLTQEEFLADGRVAVVRRRAADLQLTATILSYTVVVEDTENDDIPSLQRITMETALKLMDPLSPGEELADLGTLITESFYNADPRGVAYVIEPEAKERALAALARQIVRQTITGFPASLRALPAGITLERPLGAPEDPAGIIRGGEIPPR